MRRGSEKAQTASERDGSGLRAQEVAFAVFAVGRAEHLGQALRDSQQRRSCHHNTLQPRFRNPRERSAHLRDDLTAGEH